RGFPVEIHAGSRSRPKAGHFPVSGGTIMPRLTPRPGHRPTSGLRRWLRLPGVGAVLMLAACSTYQPGQLQIDRSIQAKSQNSRVEVLVLHYTSTGNENSLKILSERNVSAHYLVTDEPRPHVYRLVDENRRAWHAGVSSWYGRSDINTSSIGVEIVNLGRDRKSVV